jgi:FixJ family two-component response regulator
MAEAEAVNGRKPIVYVVDDDEAVRNAIRLLLKTVGYAVTLYGSPEDFLAAYRDDQPGCLLLDIRMPQMSGLELQQQLNHRGATIPVIFISGHADIPMAVEAMQHGAFDFLQKPFRDQDLLDRVQRGFARDAANRAQLVEIDRIRARLETLTSREREVLQLIAAGKLNKVVAAELGVSPRTVEIHRARVMEKMEAPSLAQLVRMVMELERHS